jgi:hypothetical protein
MQHVIDNIAKPLSAVHRFIFLEFDTLCSFHPLKANTGADRPPNLKKFVGRK